MPRLSQYIEANEDKKYTAVFRAKFQRDVSVQVRLDVSRLGQFSSVRLKIRAKIDIQKSPCIFCLHLPIQMLLPLQYICLYARDAKSEDFYRSIPDFLSPKFLRSLNDIFLKSRQSEFSVFFRLFCSQNDLELDSQLHLPALHYSCL